MVEHFYVKLGDPSYIDFSDIAWKKHTYMPSILPIRLLPTCLTKYMYFNYNYTYL